MRVSNTLISCTCFENQLPAGGLVYRLKLGEWNWTQEEEIEVEAGGHCTLYQDAILFTSGHSYNLTSGSWSKVGNFPMSSICLFPRWFALLQLSPLALWMDSPCFLALLTEHRFSDWVPNMCDNVFAISMD